MRDHKTRARKSQEYKQVIGLLVLVLAVSAVSFSLGVVVGKRNVPKVADQNASGQRKAVAEVSQKEKIEASPEDAPKVNLTFYDTLPKGEETPLGSGINPPPEESSHQEPVPVQEVQAESQKPEPRPEPSKPKPPPVTSGEYVVQVASFQSEPDARKVQTRLLGKGHRAFLQRVDLAEKGVWTRVYVGFFNTKEGAMQVSERLKAEDKFSPMVRRRQ